MNRIVFNHDGKCVFVVFMVCSEKLFVGEMFIDLVHFVNRAAATAVCAYSDFYWSCVFISGGCV